MLFTIEKEYDDIIFNQCSNFEQNKSTKYDYRYNETMFKTHMFKTFSRECYCMVDGVPFRSNEGTAVGRTEGSLRVWS